MSEFVVHMTFGRVEHTWCERHGEHHDKARVYSVDDDGTVTDIGYWCDKNDLTPEAVLNEAIQHIWDDLALAKNDLLGGSWAFWEDLTPDQRRTAHDRIAPFVTATLPDIPADPEPDDE